MNESPKKHRVTIDSFDSNCIGNETEYLNAIIDKCDFMIFVTSDCPFSFKLKQLIDQHGIPHSEMYLDNHVNGPRLQSKLNEMTGGKQLPYVFVKRQFIGGYAETMELISLGLLEDVTKGVDVSQFVYDLVVIGGGTSGIATALEAAKFGKKVAVCDSMTPTRHGTTWGLGGSPGGSGSVSKDLFHRASLLSHDFSDAPFFGWDVEKPTSYNWPKLAKTLEEHLKSVSWIHRKNLREAGVEYMNGWARFKDNHTVSLTDHEGHDKDVTSRTFVIATGSKHRPLEVKGEEDNTLSVDDLYSLRAFEGKRALVIGSDKEGLEVAGILNGLSIETSVIIRRAILPSGDTCVAERLRKSLEGLGVKFIDSVTVMAFSKVGQSIRVEGKRVTQGPHPRPNDFAQRKLSELGSRKSPPPGFEGETDGTTLDGGVDSKWKVVGSKTIQVDSNKMVDEKKASKEPSKTEGVAPGSKELSKNEVSGNGDGGKAVEGKDVPSTEGSKTKPSEGDTEDYLEEFQVVVVAAGRMPNVADLGLQNLTVQLCKGTCKIQVNEFDQTTVENIFAVGQVTNAINSDIQGVAKKAGQLLARRMFNSSNLKMEYRKVPMFVLTPVQYAHIGDTEATASRIHGKVDVYINEFSTPRSSLSNRFDNRSFVKLICAQRVPTVGSQVLGIHLVAPNAGEVIQGFVPSFIQGTLTKEQLDEMAGVHPSIAEVFSDLTITKASGKEIGLNVI